MTLSDEDRAAIEDYRRKHGEGPFLAVDAVVTSADGAVLLVRRSKPPQKGRLAFPGGFLEADETLLACAMRELSEETGLDLRDMVTEPVPPPLLRDAPGRDKRARIVSAVFRFRLMQTADELAVAGDDDAAEARWVFLDGSQKAQDFYADHYQVLVELGLVSG